MSGTGRTEHSTSEFLSSTILCLASAFRTPRQAVIDQALVFSTVYFRPATLSAQLSYRAAPIVASAFMEAKQTTKLEDVAQLSGVSPASVSRVLNHPSKVRPSVRARVERAMLDLNYVPHGAARSLASNQTRTMGAVVPMFDISLFARIVDGVQETIHENGYTLLLAKCNYDPEREAAEVRALVERGIDGLILVGASRKDEIYDLLRSRRIPFVTMCAYAPNAPWACVGWDNTAAAKKIAQYLIDLGHRQFGIISSITRNNDRASARLAGFTSALQDAGIEINRKAIFESGHTIAEARTAMSRLLLLPTRPTAVMCGNDTLAYGALQECIWSGVRVPDDVSITGFDDIEIAAHCVPALTTLRVPAQEVGRQAALIILAAQQSQARLNSVRFDLELIVRGTTQRFTSTNQLKAVEGNGAAQRL